MAIRLFPSRYGNSPSGGRISSAGRIITMDKLDIPHLIQLIYSGYRAAEH